MRQFNVGDRVEIVAREGIYRTVGMTGTVVFVYDNNRIAVEHDQEFEDGHPCTYEGVAHSAPGRGLWYHHPFRQLKIISDLKINPDLNLNSII